MIILFSDQSGHVLELDLNLILHVMDFTSPETLILIHLIYVLHRLNNIQENFGFIFLLLASDDALHRGHQHQFVLGGVCRLLIHHSVKGVANDRDQQFTKPLGTNRIV